MDWFSPIDPSKKNSEFIAVKLLESGMGKI